MAPEFSGNPRRYLRIATWLTVGMVGWLYAVFAGVQYLVYGQAWPLGWKTVVATVVFAAWFARFFYHSMMRLDAQFGSGRAWQLVERTVKLPERRPPAQPPRSQ